jgi:uncharacterized protein (DUF1330 family)
VLVRGGAAQAKEGDWAPQRLVVIQFDSLDRANAFYDSDSYRAARAARASAASMRLVVVEGVPG